MHPHPSLTALIDLAGHAGTPSFPAALAAHRAFADQQRDSLALMAGMLAEREVVVSEQSDRLTVLDYVARFATADHRGLDAHPSIYLGGDAWGTALASLQDDGFVAPCSRTGEVLVTEAGREALARWRRMPAEIEAELLAGVNAALGVPASVEVVRV